jgi:hypothetical protein
MWWAFKWLSSTPQNSIGKFVGNWKIWSIHLEIWSSQKENTHNSWFWDLPSFSLCLSGHQSNVMPACGWCFSW